MIIRPVYTITFALLFLCALTFVSVAQNATLLYVNGSEFEYFRYDRAGSSIQGVSYGSNSYMDQSPTNENLLIKICHQNLTVDNRIDLAYTSESGNLRESVLLNRPRVVSVYEQNVSGVLNNCTTSDIDIASTRALYPGYIRPYIYNGSQNTPLISTFTNLSQWFNGSYEMEINVQAPPKTYYISTKEILDESGVAITTQDPLLVTSLLDQNGSSLSEDALEPSEALTYTGSFQGGESVYVNGVLALEVEVYNPCDPINASGYYIVNNSVFNQSSSCIIINSTSNLVINFGGELIDGDNQTNGSKAPGTCPVVIEDSTNITVEQFLVQEYYHGICIVNSTVNLLGSGTFFNNNGAFIDLNSVVTFQDVSFSSNNNTDIKSVNNSHVSLFNTSFTSATIQVDFTNAQVRGVSVEPSPPPINGATDIDQYVEFNDLPGPSWAQINFLYEEPLPNSVVTDNLSVFKFNGTYQTRNITSIVEINGTNTTNSSLVTDWYDGNWSEIFTLISPSEGLIVTQNISNFSVFAPFGFETEAESENPDPEPEPVSVSSPTGGGGGGGGSTPATSGAEDFDYIIEALDIELELLTPEITLQQGEAGEIEFNITNKGDISAELLVVDPRERRGWQGTNSTIRDLDSNESVLGTFQLAPYEKEFPQTYFIPVSVYAVAEGRAIKVTQEVLKVVVIPRGNLRRIKIVEYPPVIEIPPFTELNVSFLADNIGDHDLNGVTIQFDETECLLGITGANDIRRKETKAIFYTFESAAQGICDYNLKFYEGEKLVGFVPVQFIIRTRSIWEEPLKVSLLLVTLAAWTALTVFVVSRRRNKKGEFQE